MKAKKAFVLGVVALFLISLLGGGAFAAKKVANVRDHQEYTYPSYGAICSSDDAFINYDYDVRSTIWDNGHYQFHVVYHLTITDADGKVTGRVPEVAHESAGPGGLPYSYSAQGQIVCNGQGVIQYIHFTATVGEDGTIKQQHYRFN